MKIKLKKYLVLAGAALALVWFLYESGNIGTDHKMKHETGESNYEWPSGKPKAK